MKVIHRAVCGTAVTAAIFFHAFTATQICAQILPTNNFTTSDGLAQNNVTQIFQDTKGYVWVGTGEGLSRFDGYEFKNYTKADGLSSSYVNDVTADRNGRLWVAINEGGIARMVDDPGDKKFVLYSISDIHRAKNVNRIIFDQENRLWCATEAGVFRARSTEVVDGDFEFVGPAGDYSPAREALVDTKGRVWFGLIDRVLRIENEGLTYFDLKSGERDHVNGIAEDRAGRIFVSTDHGVHAFSETELRMQDLGVALVSDQLIETIGAADGGSLWIGTTRGLIRYTAGVQTIYSKANGIAGDSVRTIYTDRDNGLWIGLRGKGLSYRANNAVVTFVDPLVSKPDRFAEDEDGNVFVQTGCHPDLIRLVKIANERIETVGFPPVRSEGCRKNYFLRTADHHWWAMFGGSLSIFDRLTSTAGKPVTLFGGERVDEYLEIYEDRSGKMWLSAADKNLYAAEPNTPRFELVARNIGALIILYDSRGVLWLANNVFLGRLHNDGHLDQIKNIDGSEIQPRAIFEDSTGRIWIGTRYDGVLYTDDPDAAAPAFKKMTTDDGITSNSIWTITGDDEGGIYFGTGRGVVRYDRSSGLVRNFTSADGVPESVVNSLFKDSHGHIWVASDGSVSRIDPAALNTPSRPPQVFISRIVIDGEELPLAETGVANFSTPDLSADQNNVSVRFVAPGRAGERSVSYRYMLEGYDRDWSPPGKQREIGLANLGAGSYRFLVKAIDSRGVESEMPAALQFQILPPIWMRWWFLTLVALAIGGVLYLLYRYRLARVVELERMRTRIATDLHDDIGSNLTRIALMSEVLNQQATNGSAMKMLPSIANIARESVASMNDIVWAISPEHDRVLDLTRRMRQHAEEVFTIRDIDLAFVSEPSDSELKLAVGVRRDVLLIFKEAVNNAARHSGCTRVEIQFICTASNLNLGIADNGRGFTQDLEHDGHGLSSMARRAASLGGKLTIDSGEGRGTTVNFEMPLR